MNTRLNQLWDQLQTGNQSGYRQIRYSDQAVAEYFVAINEGATRSLILYIPDKLWQKFSGFQDTSYENLAISFHVRNGKGWFSITLKANDLSEFFDDLIYSLWNRIERIGNHEECANEFIKAYWTWARFFDVNLSNKLSMEEIMGLFAELTFLKMLIEESQRDIDTLLNSWTGPYKDEKDFILPERIIEIKAHGSSNHSIWISSLNQLTEVDGKDTWLGLMELITGRNGISLSDLINDIATFVKNSGSDTQKLYARLFEVGINRENLHLYNTPRFTSQPFRFYDTAVDGFPKLTRQTVTNEKIEDVRYKIRIASLNAFEKPLNIKEL